MKLLPINELKYEDYRLNLMLDCYKWDPQFEDNNTIAKHVLVLTQQEHKLLIDLLEKLDKETIEAENTINQHPKLICKLLLPKNIQKEVFSMKNYNPNQHIRLMRYDFHPTIDGTWAVSEVNSDVPGGFAESSFMPKLALNYVDEKNLTYFDFSKQMVQAIKNKVKANGTIMMVHCSCFSDDRQVMQFLGDRLKEEGFEVLYGTGDHVRFKDNQAYSILDGHQKPLDGIFRFTPVEWLSEIKPNHWSGFFTTTTPSCNHPVSILVQTKRFPFIWKQLDKLNVDLTYWQKLLPTTIPAWKAWKQKGFIFKPCCGRVGENISIKESCTKKEYRQIIWRVITTPWKYIAQKKFISEPLQFDGEQYHLCLGVYSVEGKFAGYYARVSKTARIDSNAADIAVLIEKEDKKDE